MNARKLADPMPLLYYPAGEKYIYIAPGPAVLLFAIDAKIIVRNNLISRRPVQQPERHPFAEGTCVCTLVEQPVRKALATCEIVDKTEYEDTLELWCDFADALAEQIHEGEEDLQKLLDTTWRQPRSTSPVPGDLPVAEDAGDVDLDDDDDAMLA